ncbi:hypothetical protein E6O75_ATG08955 [Venturia nashicola]|uniref:Uncharacterized protein n=1 Tax=Venturia nashicola TaxID=86259 RepID=A0A4Z1NRT4_9PEZI|nr:hypothetical protein E6O75_ATG08955 [Venturia nashicola]
MICTGLFTALSSTGLFTALSSSGLFTALSSSGILTALSSTGLFTALSSSGIFTARQEIHMTHSKCAFLSIPRGGHRWETSKIEPWRSTRLTSLSRGTLDCNLTTHCTAI